MTEIISQVTSLVVLIVLFGAGWLGTIVAGYMKQEKVLSQLANKEAYVDIAVKAVQQVYKDLDGPAKLVKAKAKVVDYLNRKKIPFTANELDDLIESAVKEMKDAAKEVLEEESEVEQDV